MLDRSTGLAISRVEWLSLARQRPKASSDGQGSGTCRNTGLDIECANIYL